MLDAHIQPYVMNFMILGHSERPENATKQIFIPVNQHVGEPIFDTCKVSHDNP